MSTGAALAIILVILGVTGLGVLLFMYLGPGGSARSSQYRALMTRGSGSVTASSIREGARSGSAQVVTKQTLDTLKREQRKKYKPQKFTLEQKFFMAGMFSAAEQRDYRRMRMLAPIICVPAFGYLIFSLMGGAEGLLLGVITGALIGFQLPVSVLGRRIEARAEDILYYLPLVIEQLAIGVSSSLDIGPCIQRVVQMADERDTHNAVTEFFKVAQNHVRTGVSLEEALTEIGKLSGHTELKHTFNSLAQVVRHGGEITRQLQELADAVSLQRESKIEAKIKKLELIATGPVGLVFVGFMLILLTGFGLQMKSAF